jgi:hypothetical protein
LTLLFILNLWGRLSDYDNNRKALKEKSKTEGVL